LLGILIEVLAMTFSEVIKIFATSLPGTDSYVKLRNAMRELIQEDPNNASVYFLIFGFARTYVMLYEDQEVSPQFAEDNQKVMLSYLNILDRALREQSAESIYQALNKVVSEYENSKKVF
jgi:translation initiation factor 2B subunit (eIF-2B alpha/beta/delta family)